MKKNLFKIVAGLSESTSGLPDEISKLLEALPSNGDASQIIKSVKFLFQTYTETTAYDFVHFVLTKVANHRQKFLLPDSVSESSTKNFLVNVKFYHLDGEGSSLLEKFKALKIKSEDQNDSGCPPSPASSTISLPSQVIPAKPVSPEAGFGFGDLVPTSSTPVSKPKDWRPVLPETVLNAINALPKNIYSPRHLSRINQAVEALFEKYPGGSEAYVLFVLGAESGLTEGMKLHALRDPLKSTTPFSEIKFYSQYSGNVNHTGEKIYDPNSQLSVKFYGMKTAEQIVDEAFAQFTTSPPDADSLSVRSNPYIDVAHSDQDNLLLHALDIYSGLEKPNDKKKVAPIIIELMNKYEGSVNSSVLERLKFFKIEPKDKKLKDIVTQIINAGTKNIQDPNFFLNQDDLNCFVATTGSSQGELPGLDFMMY